MAQVIQALLPVVMALVTAWLFVWPSYRSRRARLVWCVFLAFCGSRMWPAIFFWNCTSAPGWPMWLLVFWNWAYAGMVVLFLVSLIWRVRFGRRFLLPFVAWAVATAGMVGAMAFPRINPVEIPFRNLPDSLDGYRIVQLSDLHLSPAFPASRMKRLVAAVNRLSPDLVCLTGDYSGGETEVVADTLSLITELKAKDGVLAVTGNHEYYRDWWAWRPYYKRWGVRFLTNDCVRVRSGLTVGGVNDLEVLRWGLENPPDENRVFESAAYGDFRLLLSHRPRYAHDNVERRGVDLQLSGHTHGGLMPILSLAAKLRDRGFVRGLYRFPHGGALYVTTGVGPWDTLPFRFGCPPEIALITLRKEKTP